MSSMNKTFSFFGILIANGFLLPLPMDTVGIQTNAPAEIDAWKPFQPLRNSTLTVTREPHAEATLNSEYTWEFEWRPERHIYPGTEIEFRSLNLHAYFLYKYTKIELEGGGATVTFRRRAELKSSDIRSLGGQWIIARARLQYGLREGQPLRVRLTAVPPAVAGHYDAVTLWYSEPVAGREGESKNRQFTKDPRAQALLEVGPGPVQKFLIYSHPMPGTNGKVRTVLLPQDRYGNPTEFRETVSVSLHWNGKTWTDQVKAAKTIHTDAPQSIGRLQASVPMKNLAPAENVSNGTRAGGQLVVTGNPVWAASPDGKLAAFGEFHWHTEMSGDGILSLPHGLTYARDHLNLQYISPSDHSPSPGKWRYTVGVLNSFNDTDNFATFFGYEHSTNRGHENYYFVDPDHPVSPVGKLYSSVIGRGRGKDLASLPLFLSEYDTADQPFIAIPHHVNAVAETRRLSDDTPYWFQYPWTRPSKYHRLVEILQLRGNMERDSYPEDAWRGWYTYGASVQDALGRGYKLGFTGGSDNHTARPGNPFFYLENGARIPTDSISLTGLWTDRIERGEVFSALYARHTWAVWDTRAIVYFTVNGAQAGGEIEVRKGDPLTARIKLSAEDPLQSIEIVSEKKSVWIASETNLDFDLKIPLTRADHSTYFYLRALQRNGGIIYASPVFVSVEP